MSLKALASRLARRQGQPQGATPQTNEELERMKRQQAQAEKAAEKARADLLAAQALAQTAAAERDGVRIESALTGAASKARALNAGQVASLLRNKVKLVDGKMSVEGSDKDVDTYVSEWLNGEGKHFLPASVPGGGSGGPANPNPPPAKNAHDLTTNAGLTAYARERAAGATRTIGNRAVTVPGAPAQAPATPGGVTQK